MNWVIYKKVWLALCHPALEDFFFFFLFFLFLSFITFQFRFPMSYLLFHARKLQDVSGSGNLSYIWWAWWGVIHRALEAEQIWIKLWKKVEERWELIKGLNQKVNGITWNLKVMYFGKSTHKSSYRLGQLGGELQNHKIFLPHHDWFSDIKYFLTSNSEEKEQCLDLGLFYLYLTF